MPAIAPQIMGPRSQAPSEKATTAAIATTIVPLTDVSSPNSRSRCSATTTVRARIPSGTRSILGLTAAAHAARDTAAAQHTALQIRRPTSIPATAGLAGVADRRWKLLLELIG